jgi:exonuclease SbcC
VIEKEIRELRERAEEIELPTLPSGIIYSKEFLAQVAKDKERLAGKISGAEALIEANRPAKDANDTYLNQHADVEKRVKEQEILVEKKNRELKVLKAGIEGIEKTAESRRMRFRPGVESYMDEILPSLTSGRYKAVLLDEDFGVQVFDPEAGEYRPKDVFSGGTEDQFLLAMRLAFALALVPEAKGTTLEFLWLDEPLGSSDEIRRSGIIDYVNTTLSKRFSQIFIVSHVGGLEEQVPNVIRVENGKVQT